MDFDILMPLLIMLLYALPQFFRKRKKQQYEYPEIPELPEEQITIPVEEVKPQFKGSHASVGSGYSAAAIAGENLPLEVLAVQPVQALPQVHNRWENQLDQALIVNGFIFSEILQPPRAVRPLAPRFNRR